MGRPEKPVDASGGAVAAFASELRQLRAQAGNPTYRDMARCALYSASVLSSAASGTRLPTLQVTLAFVAACGGDREVWRRRWLDVSGGVHIDVASRTMVPDVPARQGMPRPAQLPLRPRGFVGRVEELRRLSTVSGAPVVISGPGGVGKTEFALHHAHDVASDMVDGQLYADLGPLAAGELGAQTVLSGFLRALGVPAEHSLDQQAGLYRSLLAERRLLVLLDNVRDERQVRPLLAETRHSVTIVVSRTPLLGLRDVRRVRLDVLPRADSIAMIAAAMPHLVEADPEGCDRLAELCDDLPLALDIAARKLAARPGTSLSRVTSEPRAMLGWLRIGDMSVEESLHSAYLQLSDAARVLLQQLVRQSAASHVEDELVEELADAGMLHRDGVTYRLGTLVRSFVASHVLQPRFELIVSPGQTCRTTIASS